MLNGKATRIPIAVGLIKKVIVKTSERKKKIQIMQNNCIRFCLKLDKMHHVSKEEFKFIN